MFPWNNNEVDATEAAIELAEELDVDLSKVEGTGTEGRVTKPDVEAFIEGTDGSVEEEEVFPLEELDGGLVVSNGDEEEESEEEVFIPVEIEEGGFPQDTRIIDEETTKRLLNNAAYRFRNISSRVAFMGYGDDQALFALFLASWQVRSGGVFYVPLDLSDYDQLAEWKRIENEETPEGFVALCAP